LHNTITVTITCATHTNTVTITRATHTNTVTITCATHTRTVADASMQGWGYGPLSWICNSAMCR